MYYKIEENAEIAALFFLRVCPKGGTKNSPPRSSHSHPSRIVYLHRFPGQKIDQRTTKHPDSTLPKRGVQNCQKNRPGKKKSGFDMKFSVEKSPTFYAAY